jgi:prepilin-type N-terminal cleavage/methylation domain-containing protein
LRKGATGLETGKQLRETKNVNYVKAILERLRSRREDRGTQGGFTIIEILVVIVILAISAAMVMIAVQDHTSNANQATCVTDLATVDSATQTYMAQVGAAPPSVGALTSAVNIGNASQPRLVGPWLHNAIGGSSDFSITVAPKMTAGENPVPVSPPDTTITVTVPGATTGHTYTPATETAGAACTAAGVH